MTSHPPVSSLQPDERLALRHAAERLVTEFDGSVDTQTVEEYVRSSYLHLMEHAKVTRFVPLLAERFARQRLTAFAMVEGRHEAGVPAVIFLDEHNAGRSQMATALAGALGEGRVVAWSGGRVPTAEVDENVLAAMRELGIELRGEFPKPWTPEVLAAADRIIVMGTDFGAASVTSPVVSWDVPDPLGRTLEAVRAIRDDIRARVVDLLASVAVPAPRG